MGTGNNPKKASSKLSSEASSVFTVYCHIHRESGRRYVGQTKKTMLQRWNQHVYTAQKSSSGWSHFANAIRKYGKDAFDHEILETCRTVEEANASEQRWIAHFNTRDRLFGFNLTKGGGHMPYPIRVPWDRPDYREKIIPVLARMNEASSEERSERSSKMWSDPTSRANILAGTQEAIRRPEVRAKLSASSTELWKDPEFREKNLAAAAAGRTPEVLEKLRRNWDDPGFRERCSVGTRARSEAEAAKTHCRNGHPRTPENLDSQRECRVCIAERRREARASCPKGHPYEDGSFSVTADGRRDCLACQADRKGSRPCSKCGRPKTRRSGGGKTRCGPCTDARIAAWKAVRTSDASRI